MKSPSASKRSQVKPAGIAASILLAFSILCPGSSDVVAQEGDPTPLNTVWVAGDDAIVTIAKDSGEATPWRSGVGDAKALAADCRAGVLWTYDGRALAAYAATGARLLRVSIERGGFSWYNNDSVDRAALILAQDDGSVWVASGKRAYRFDAQGHQVRMLSVGGNDQGPCAGHRARPPDGHHQATDRSLRCPRRGSGEHRAALQ